MTADNFAETFGDLLNEKNTAHAFDIPLEAYLEDYSKRLQECLSADDGFSKLNFTEPAFIVSRAAKVWGKKVDCLDDFLHMVLNRAISGSKENDSGAFISEGSNEESNGPSQLENIPRKQKQKMSSWTLDDLRSPKDIFRQIVPVETEHIDLNKSTDDVEVKSTLRPRISFDLHPVYRLPVSISIKNMNGDALGEYCDFFSNTFDVEQVIRLLEGHTAPVDHTMDMMELDNDLGNETGCIGNDDMLFAEPVKLESNNEQVMNLCPNLMIEDKDQSALASQPQNLELRDTLPFEPPPVFDDEAANHSQEFEIAAVAHLCERNTKVRGVVTTVNKFCVRLDPYDGSEEAKKSKPLAKTPGKPFKLPNQKQKESGSNVKLAIINNKADDLFSQHMPPLKPPPQMPASIADSVSVELSEQMVQKYNDNVLVACGRKSQPSKLREASNEIEVMEALRNDVEIPLTQEIVNIAGDLDDESDAGDDAGGADMIGEAGGTENPGFGGEYAAMDLFPNDNALPDVQVLETMLPHDVVDESRLKRIQEWDRYVEERLAAADRSPFHVNDYCSKMIRAGQQAGKKKWFSLEQTVMKLVRDSEASTKEPKTPARMNLNIRRESARSLVSLLFLANGGNIEFRPKKAGETELEVRLLSETFGHISVDEHGIEVPTPRAALTAHHQ